jgi:hypothetical protein
MTELPNDPELAYLNALDIVCVYVAAAPAPGHKPSLVGVTRNPREVIIRPTWSAWVQSTESDCMPGRWHDVCGDVARDAIKQSFAAHGIALTPNMVVLERVRANIKRLDVFLQEARVRGDLRFFNIAYRTHRLSCKNPMTYPEAIARLRSELVASHFDDTTSGPSKSIVKKIFQI